MIAKYPEDDDPTKARFTLLGKQILKSLEKAKTVQYNPSKGEYYHLLVLYGGHDSNFLNIFKLWKFVDYKCV